MKRFVCLIALSGLAGVSSVQAKTGLAHNTGLWEMTSSFVAMSDDGLVVEKERTETQCLDTGDAATFFVETLAPGNCALKNYRRDATGLDLVALEPATFQRLQPVVAEGDVVALGRFAIADAAELLAELHSLWDLVRWHRSNLS